MWEHESEASDMYLEIDSDPELSDDEKKARKEEVYEKLRIINEEGDGLKRVIVKWGLNEREAYMCESALINAMGLLSKRVSRRPFSRSPECFARLSLSVRFYL